MTPENEVKNACLELLDLYGLPAMRINVHGQKVGKSYIRPVPNGTADILTCIPSGRLLWIETKAGKNTQSEDQAAFQAKWERGGALYIVVWSGEQLEKELARIAKEMEAA